MAKDRTSVDPTENVRELFNADGRYRDALRDADNRYQNAMRGAEIKRLDDLAEAKEKSDVRIENLLRVQVENTSVLLSTQLDRVTTALGSRIAELEKKSWETGGRGVGRGDVVGWIAAALAAAVAIIAIFARVGGVVG